MSRSELAEMGMIYSELEIYFCRDRESESERDKRISRVMQSPLSFHTHDPTEEDVSSLYFTILYQ